MSTPERLFLIDGMSAVYRAYHAIRNLSTRAGFPTNALYGFTTTLRKISQQHKPDYLGVALEGEGPTLRQTQFEQYKAHRKPMPDELARQLPYVERICAALRIPIIRQTGYEADDVLGTLARKAADAGLVAVIVTIDKDLFQLVSDRIFVMDPRTDTIMDAQAVEEKMGVPPSRIIDWLALAGDASDNIPGAPGIGDKGARALIREFGSVDACLARYEEVARKTYREGLRDHADLIRQCRDLATIPTDLAIELDLRALRRSDPDMALAQPLFTELEFHSLLKEWTGAPTTAPAQGPTGTRLLFQGMDEGPTPAPDPAASGDYQGVATADVFAQVTREIRQGRRVAVARPPAGLDGLGFSGGSGRGFFVSWPEDLAPRRDLEVAVQDLLGDDSVTKIFFDLKAARHALLPHGLLPASASADLALMAYLLDPQAVSYQPAKLAFDYLGYRAMEPPDEAAGPAAVRAFMGEQADLIGRLEEHLAPELAAAGLEGLYRDIERPLVDVLFDMEQAGVRMDTTRLADLSGRLQQELDRLTQKIYAAAGLEFNINSPKQLGEVLFEKHRLPSTRRTQKTKNYATDSGTLEALAEAHELPQLVLEYRQVAKLKSTYVDALPRLVRPESGRIHTSFHQTVTATGRLSSSDPNFQNLPIRTEMGRMIRAAVVPEPGHQLLSVDYSQVELRILAHFSRDPVLLDAFRRGEDIHQRTAQEVFGLQAQMEPAECRRRAKTINFGVIYGQSAFGLARELKVPRYEAQRFIDAYFARYRGVNAWIDATLEAARQAGAVKTLFGRVRPVPDLHSKDANRRGFAERVAVNSPIQGTAADLMKMAMIEVWQALRTRHPGARIILQVHDELVLEVPEAELADVRALVREKMENVYPLLVPLQVDVRYGSNWRDLKKED